MINWITELTSWGKGLAAVAGGIAGFVTIWKVIRAIYLHVKKVNGTLSGFLQTIPILTQIALEFKPNGGGSLRDAIDRLEKGASLSEQRTRALISYLDIASFEADSKGQCVWVSKKWTELAGLSQEEAHGNGWVIALPEHERERVFDEWILAIEQQREFFLVYEIGVSKLTKVRAVTTIVRDKKGDIISFIGTLTPVAKNPKVV